MCVYAKQRGAFAKPFLTWKRDYIIRVDVCSLLLSSTQCPSVLLCFHLWPVWFYHSFNINAKTARLSEKKVTEYTGRFIMFSVIANIYNKKTKGPTVMELFTATGKLKTFFVDN
jgi:hypothetical protein